MSTALAASLLAWYDRHARVLPWRVGPNKRAARPDPYRVWLSEIMLQQTTVVTVGPYFAEFLRRWPDVNALAQAPIDDVLAAWAGLGYYARARNLHKCARYVAEELGGVFPDTEEGLLTLPGVGPYTAAAIASIAFDVPAAVIDGNVERVIARVFKIDTPLPAAKPEIRNAVAGIVPEQRPGDFAQATMDLGATVCVPRNPRCVICPLMAGCKARKQGLAEELPRRAPKAEKPTRRGLAFVLARKDGAILLRRRLEKGLLGGMDEVPSSAWREGRFVEATALGEAPVPARWQVMDGLVRHTFTHFHLELVVARATATTARLGEQVPGAVWCPLDRLTERALPTVMRKVIAHAAKA
ncbi:MAG: A/G-specific adenine glycosylase [Alphaproteobacteria bacterium]|nr:A/G-specific adenine glycosylase [Alphaproteobacteria bacterium]